jgi:hypothetical protein
VAIADRAELKSETLSTFHRLRGRRQADAFVFLEGEAG